jgi:protocatechuate 3,4-dioxygenase alpha subunit
VTLQATTWQTVGSFFSIGLYRLYRDNVAPLGVSGERVEISGRIFDGDGRPVPDAVVEIWQANSHGKYAHPEDWWNKHDGQL